jgi:hypothetical protein
MGIRVDQQVEGEMHIWERLTKQGRNELLALGPGGRYPGPEIVADVIHRNELIGAR